MDQHNMANGLRKLADMLDNDQAWMQEIWVNIDHEIKYYSDYGSGYTKSFHTGHSMATIRMEIRAPLHVAQQFQEPRQLESDRKLLL